MSLRAQKLSAARLTAIGAFRCAVLGYFDWKRKEYLRIPVDRQVEVVSLLGDIALKDDEPHLHMHAVMARPTAAPGGHLPEGHVRPTLEIMITQTPAHLQRCHDEAFGLALVRPREDAG